MAAAVGAPDLSRLSRRSPKLHTMSRFRPNMRSVSLMIVVPLIEAASFPGAPLPPPAASASTVFWSDTAAATTALPLPDDGDGTDEAESSSDDDWSEWPGIATAEPSALNQRPAAKQTPRRTSPDATRGSSTTAVSDSVVSYESQPLKTLEKLQQMLDDTDYITVSKSKSPETAAPVRPATAATASSKLNEAAKENSMARPVPGAEPQSPSHEYMIPKPTLIQSPDPLWQSKDRARYKRQQLRLRKALAERAQASSTEPKASAPIQPGQQQQLAAPLLVPSDDEVSDDTDDGLGYTLPNLPVYYSDAEMESDDQEYPGYSQQSQAVSQPNMHSAGAPGSVSGYLLPPPPPPPVPGQYYSPYPAQHQGPMPPASMYTRPYPWTQSAMPLEAYRDTIPGHYAYPQQHPPAQYPPYPYPHGYPYAYPQSGPQPPPVPPSTAPGKSPKYTQRSQQTKMTRFQPKSLTMNASRSTRMAPTEVTQPPKTLQPSQPLTTTIAAAANDAPMQPMVAQHALPYFYLPHPATWSSAVVPVEHSQSLAEASSKISFGAIFKLSLLMVIVAVSCYSAVSPRTLPLSQYNMQFYENVRLVSLSTVVPLITMLSVFDARENDVNVWMNTFFVSFTFGYALTLVAEIVATTLVRLGIFAWSEPSVFSLTPKVPLLTLPWMLKDVGYRPKRITLFAADAAASCVAAPVIEELVKLKLLEWTTTLPKNFRWTLRDSKTSKNKKTYAEALYRGPGEKDATNANKYVAQMLAVSLGVKLCDTGRRILMYTKDHHANKSFYAFCRGVFPIHELCGTMTALALAKRDLLGVEYKTWQILAPAVVVHAMANFRGMKPVFKWNAATPWSEMQLSPINVADPSTLFQLLKKGYAKLMWLIVLSRVLGYCIKNYYMINRHALKRTTTYAGKHAAFSAELATAEVLKKQKQK